MIPTTSKTEFLFSLIKVVESSVWEGELGSETACREGWVNKFFT